MLVLQIMIEAVAVMKLALQNHVQQRDAAKMRDFLAPHTRTVVQIWDVLFRGRPLRPQFRACH